jgi:hypothetical protein
LIFWQFGCGNPQEAGILGVRLEHVNEAPYLHEV